jgi:predicted esterase
VTITYGQLHADAMDLYDQQAFAEALELLTREGDAFPDQSPTILYLRSCLATRIGLTELALNILADAVQRGYWYGERMMRQSPSWGPLQGVPEFERMAVICAQREAQAQADPSIFVEEPAEGAGGARARRLFIALHGNGDRAANALVCWRPVVARGWALAAFQSSQIAATETYGWFDVDAAEREVARGFAELSKVRAVDAQRTIVAGFSTGGDLALRLALAHRIPAHGFILLGPTGPTVDSLGALSALVRGAAPGTRGYIVVGASDGNVAPDYARALARILNGGGMPCQVEAFPGLGHAYPRDIGPVLDRALAFIQG